ncbi:active regulator of SIRT1-like isoform X2 [Eriocheir sinensis]|uniref:active regulator of SIRT1-like isoform X2 n=1 Tax=Eriocheir sinensis TaxID=95602 RepID=UPI0021C96042|nr:active regulator of SIRT1-like isoform X2 [Eriocheir sinensis]
MSWSLVKRGLELCEEDQQATKSRKVEKKVTAGKASRHQREKKAAKQRKIGEQRQQEVKDLFSSQKQVTSALERYRQNVPKDRTLDNIKLLKKIDKKRTPKEYVEKVVSQHTKQLDRRGGVRELPQSQGKKKPEETSVFSDEDFEKLNKEWLKLY